MAWSNPLPLKLIPVSVDAFTPPAGCTYLPLGAHPGAWGVQRKHHVHEGVDLYAPSGTAVFAVEAGTVSSIAAFTGPSAGMPWWQDTEAVWVEGASGAVLYGELIPAVRVGQTLAAGDLIGHVTPVLRQNKGRPTAMLHLELHLPGTTVAPEWLVMGERPATLMDPSPYLLSVVQ